jgi:hypothetical protein
LDAFWSPLELPWTPLDLVRDGCFWQTVSYIKNQNEIRNLLQNKLSKLQYQRLFLLIERGKRKKKRSWGERKCTPTFLQPSNRFSTDLSATTNYFHKFLSSIENLLTRNWSNFLKTGTYVAT